MNEDSVYRPSLTLSQPIYSYWDSFGLAAQLSLCMQTVQREYNKNYSDSFYFLLFCVVGRRAAER